MDWKHFKSWVVSLLYFLMGAVSCAQAKAPEPCFPVQNEAFALRKPIEAFIQPTATGIPLSGTFGCVRNGGKKFHEGMDLLSLQKDKNGNPTDPILAIWPGKVAYLCNKPGPYGKYIVLEHKHLQPSFYTLYAHLSRIEPQLKIGDNVPQGMTIGTMGHSSTLKIPKARSHLHFEIGFQLSDQFDLWYNKQAFTVPNPHGKWNGMNLLGMDPINFFEGFRDGTLADLVAYVKSLPTAFTITILNPKTPSFIKNYPCLLQSPLPSIKDLKGWRIDFTWYGLPKQWTPITQASNPLKGPTLESHSSSEIHKMINRKTLIKSKKGKVQIGPHTQQILDILFIGL